MIIKQWQYQYARIPKQPLNAKIKSIPPTLVALVWSCVEGVGCCCGARYNWKAEEEYRLFKPSGRHRGHDGKTKPEPPGVGDATSLMVEQRGKHCFCFVTLGLTTTSRLRMPQKCKSRIRIGSLLRHVESAHWEITGLSRVFIRGSYFLFLFIYLFFSYVVNLQHKVKISGDKY